MRARRVNRAPNTALEAELEAMEQSLEAREEAETRA
eukprot:COSAG01_NODE_48839_length_377_cov_1.269784_1_plen_35_part_01